MEFSISDVSNEIDEETRGLIADLILAWARYDSLVTQWTYRTFNMTADEGSIFIGNMDTRTKLERIKALYKHYGHTSSVEKVAELAKLSKPHTEVRNTICHKTCGGHSRSDPDRLVFSSGKIFPQKPGVMLVELIHLDQIRSAIGFAKHNADMISKIVDRLIGLQEAQHGQSPDNPPSSQPDPLREQ